MQAAFARGILDPALADLVADEIREVLCERARAGVEVTGYDPNPEVTDVARAQLDRLLPESWGVDVPLTVDVGVGKNWKDFLQRPSCQSIKNKY